MSETGYKTTVKKSGTSTAFTDEPMSLVSGNTYQITDAAKRVFDRSQVPTFKEALVAIPSSDVVSVDYLNGKVTFATPKTGTVYVTGKYMPLAAIGGGHSYSLSVSREILDDTDYVQANVSASRHRTSGLLDVAVTIGRLENLANDFFDLIEGGQAVVIEIDRGGSGDKAKGWFVLESIANAGEVATLETGDLSFQLDGDSRADFSWR
ncbi:MAG: hypothetical protein AB1896_18400 [Thermodesulfobacteriota bacterium]